MDKHCETCHWFMKQWPNDYWGQCRRHAPVSMIQVGFPGQHQENPCRWPETKPEDYCGDYKKKAGE